MQAYENYLRLKEASELFIRGSCGLKKSCLHLQISLLLCFVSLSSLDIALFAFNSFVVFKEDHGFPILWSRKGLGKNHGT